jgi:hypothetical protein
MDAEERFEQLEERRARAQEARERALAESGNTTVAQEPALPGLPPSESEPSESQTPAESEDLADAQSTEEQA